MRSKKKLPPGLYRRKKKLVDGTVVELPTLWCRWRVPGRRHAERESTKTTDVDEALRYLYAKKAETGHVRAVRRRREHVKVQELLDLVVKNYGDEEQQVPPGMYETLNFALGHLRAEDVEADQLDELCREWRRHGIRWHKPPTGDPVERPAQRVRPVTKATCNRYMAFLARGYALGREKLRLKQLTVIVPHYSEPKNPKPIPADILAAIWTGMADEPEARMKFLRFLYLVGPRKGQVLGTQAEQFTPSTGTLRWSDEDTKAGVPQTVTYTDEALDILRWFVAHRDPACSALFQENGSPLTRGQLDGTWERACKRAGLPLGRKHGGYTIHHLRHTYVSEAHDAGLSAGVIMAHTNHVQEPTMLRYLRTSAAAQQRAQEQLAAHRREQAERVKSSNVVRLVGSRGA